MDLDVEGWFLQVDACDHLASFISDCDRKTEQAKKKLAETQEALSDEVRIGLLETEGMVKVSGDGESKQRARLCRADR